MPALPTLEPLRRLRAAAAADDSLVFAVYASFGTDPILSLYPDVDAPQAAILKQALVQNLKLVAAEGVNVSAVIDLFEDDTYLVEIPAGRPQDMAVLSTWKQDMSAPQALAGFLRRTRARFPCSTIVLALEGHGGGFVPSIDPSLIKPETATHWTRNGQAGQVRWISGEKQTSFEAEAGSPALPMDNPTLPMDNPTLPLARMPMSTWALGQALQSAIKSGVPRPAIIHFNNCFNASVELLHTVAPFADHATGYANYDFFTAGAAYPALFKKLRQSPVPVSRAVFARWFALFNQAELAKQAGHPTVGSAVPLASMRKLVSPALDALANELVKSLQANRPDARKRIRDAAMAAQHYDTVPGYELKVPDQFIDIASFAAALQNSFGPGTVSTAAGKLLTVLAGFYVYGDVGSPSMAGSPAVIYDFSDKRLGLNILFPDPDLSGQWDWRSPYYLSGVPYDPVKKEPPAQRHVIDFLADPAPGRKQPWVNLINEYHLGIPFVGFFAVQPFLFPLANPKRRNGGKPGSTGEQPKRPRSPRKS